MSKENKITILFNNFFTFYKMSLNLTLRLSMQSQKALGFHPKRLIFVPKMNEGLMAME